MSSPSINSISLKSLKTIINFNINQSIMISGSLITFEQVSLSKLKINSHVQSHPADAIPTLRRPVTFKQCTHKTGSTRKGQTVNRSLRCVALRWNDKSILYGLLSRLPRPAMDFLLGPRRLLNHMIMQTNLGDSLRPTDHSISRIHQPQSGESDGKT